MALKPVFNHVPKGDSMSTKHTPGPWTLSSGKAFIQSAPDKEGRTEAVAEVWEESNARLIATVPEMLVVLKNTLTELKKLSELTPNEIGVMDELERSIQYVIAKAEGRGE